MLAIKTRMVGCTLLHIAFPLKQIQRGERSRNHSFFSLGSFSCWDDGILRPNQPQDEFTGWKLVLHIQHDFSLERLTRFDSDVVAMVQLDEQTGLVPHGVVVRRSGSLQTENEAWSS